MISRGVTIVGSLFYDGQVQVEGTIDGEVRCSALQITELGAVEGLIVAESIDVRGEANGSIYAEKLVLRTACAVQGEVTVMSCWRTAATRGEVAAPRKSGGARTRCRFPPA